MERLKKRPCPECGEDLRPVDADTYFCASCDDYIDFDGEDDEEGDDEPEDQD